MEAFEVCTKETRIGSWCGVEEPVSSRLGSEQAKPSTPLRATETDLGTRTRLCSLGTEGSESRGHIQPVGSPGQEKIVY